MKTSGPNLSLTERISAGPKVMVRLTTQLPSITSMCIQLIPASTASSSVSPSFVKSAVRILGATSTDSPRALRTNAGSQHFGFIFPELGRDSVHRTPMRGKNSGAIIWAE